MIFCIFNFTLSNYLYTALKMNYYLSRVSLLDDVSGVLLLLVELLVVDGRGILETSPPLSELSLN